MLTTQCNRHFWPLGPPLSFSFDPLRGKCLDLRAKVQADKTQKTIVCAVLQEEG